MELLQLRYFLTVASHLNISHAAREHMIPQPAMSKTISKLEKELGTPLFNREKGRLSLTEKGESFYRSVSVALSGLDNALADLSQSDAPLGGEIRLLVRQHRRTVVDCISEFKAYYPQVSFRLFYDKEPHLIKKSDLCISCESPDKWFDASQCLITEKLKLFLSRKHPLANRKRVSFEALKNEEFALLERNSFLWKQTQLLCQKAGFEPRVSFLCGDLYCLTKYIETGLAVTVGPEQSWAGLEGENTLFVNTAPEVTRSTFLFWNSAITPSRQSLVFRDFLTEFFQKKQNLR
jgi:DNA-binding transcriptional LysR family regulator